MNEGIGKSGNRPHAERRCFSTGVLTEEHTHRGLDINPTVTDPLSAGLTLFERPATTRGRFIVFYRCCFFPLVDVCECVYVRVSEGKIDIVVR